jgi:glycosyltransferase involved in cell wall biosynthesis
MPYLNRNIKVPQLLHNIYLNLTKNVSIDFSQKLPNGFDAEVYLQLNSDVRQAGIDPSTHYYTYGQHENRLYKSPELNILPGNDLTQKSSTILIVSHDASRTGAPILTLNLVQSLSKDYNVVVLLLGDGELITAFQSVAKEVIFEPALRVNAQIALPFLTQVCNRHKIFFAVINSIESRAVLPSLASLYVPTISLLHEFASYTRPRNAFLDAFLWSTKTVFSSKMTLENALSEYTHLQDFSAEVIPQGKCIVPCEAISADDKEVERIRLSLLIRPEGKSDGVFVVLGAGSVHLRKGVDLFIECASRVLRSPGGDKCRFVWVGQGYNPDDDVNYSVYLADQIQRAGIEKYIVFTGETNEIEFAYQSADLFLLSSRLDPLPNVAIDAMHCGLPVICFNKTTGIADFLIQIGLGAYCVAHYLDTMELSQKVLALVLSKTLWKKVSDQCKDASLATFCMQRYASSINILALSAQKQMNQEMLDTQEILASGLFLSTFSLPKNINMSDFSAIRSYIRSWKTKINRRKPCPGFHPGMYLEHHGLTNKESDPFADYLRNGQPQGVWNSGTITPEFGTKSPTDDVRVALHLHVYYPDMLEEIITRLEVNEIRPDLFVSVKDKKSLDLVTNTLSNYIGNIVDIQIVPNRGRDIGPFLTVFGKRLVKDYDIIGHIHTKKSLDITDRSVVEIWNNFLLENLLGGNKGGCMADAIISAMNNDIKTGIVFPDDPFVIGWSKNRQIAEQIATRLGFSSLQDEFNFPIGTMFWICSSALKRFVELDLKWEDYPSEPLPYDGSILHAIERLFGIVCTLENMRYAVTHVPGVTR